MLEIVEKSALEQYLKTDNILKVLKANKLPELPDLTGDRWLEGTPPKRMIYERIYGELLTGRDTKLKVLDVGGGFNSMTPIMAKNCDYHLLDICAHESSDQVKQIERVLTTERLHKTDWYSWQPQAKFDWIIANDLFPNVDQRLEMFLDKYLPLCKRLVLSLTYYDKPRFYQVKRVDAEEVLWYLAWNGLMVKQTLQRFSPAFESQGLEALNMSRDTSLYPNGRQVVMLALKGSLA